MFKVLLLILNTLSKNECCTYLKIYLSANQNCLLIEHLSGHIDDFIPNTNQMNLSFKLKKKKHIIQHWTLCTNITPENTFI